MAAAATPRPIARRRSSFEDGDDESSPSRLRTVAHLTKRISLGSANVVLDEGYTKRQYYMVLNCEMVMFFASEQAYSRLGPHASLATYCDKYVCLKDLQSLLYSNETNHLEFGISSRTKANQVLAWRVTFEQSTDDPWIWMKDIRALASRSGGLLLAPPSYLG